MFYYKVISFKCINGIIFFNNDELIAFGINLYVYINDQLNYYNILVWKIFGLKTKYIVN